MWFLIDKKGGMAAYTMIIMMIGRDARNVSWWWCNAAWLYLADGISMSLQFFRFLFYLCVSFALALYITSKRDVSFIFACSGCLSFYPRAHLYNMRQLSGPGFTTRTKTLDSSMSVCDGSRARCWMGRNRLRLQCDKTIGPLGFWAQQRTTTCASIYVYMMANTIDNCLIGRNGFSIMHRAFLSRLMCT